MKLSRSVAVSVSAAVVAAAAPVQAQALTGTLKKVKETGVIGLGVRASSMPFSYLTDNQTYQGYSIDLCLKVVLAVQKHLGLASLKTDLALITPATRIPLMTNGTIDLECGSTTNNLERQKQVAFAPTMFVTATHLLAKKSSNIKSLADLKGKTLVSTVGTTILKQMTIMNSERKLGMNIVAAKDHAEAFLMVETGRAVAFAMDEVLLVALVAHSKTPGDYEITKESLSVEPYGIMMRKGDPAFKKVVDDALRKVYMSRDIDRIYAKWFQAPIPPKGLSLNLPMTPQLKAVITKPTDSGDPAVYVK